MIGEAIRLVLTNLPVIFFVGAFVLAYAIKDSPEPLPARLLGWLLLLSVGFENVWFGFIHMFFPKLAAPSIGWDPSPFEFEIGAADFALGVIAIVSFWRSLDFKAAVVLFVTLFYAGVASIHIYEAVTAGNFAPNNFGVLLLLTVVKMVLLPALYLMAQRSVDRPEERFKVAANDESMLR
jgi:hypothetical protein